MYKHNITDNTFKTERISKTHNYTNKTIHRKGKVTEIKLRKRERDRKRERECEREREGGRERGYVTILLGPHVQGKRGKIFLPD